MPVFVVIRGKKLRGGEVVRQLEQADGLHIIADGMQSVAVKVAGNDDGQAVGFLAEAVDQQKLHAGADRTRRDGGARGILQTHGAVGVPERRQQRLRRRAAGHEHGLRIAIHRIVAAVDEHILADLDVTGRRVPPVGGARGDHGASRRDAGHAAGGGDGYAIAVAGEGDGHGRSAVGMVDGGQRDAAALLDGLIAAADGDMRQRRRDGEVGPRAKTPRADDEQGMRAARRNERAAVRGFTVQIARTAVVAQGDPVGVHAARRGAFEDRRFGHLAAVQVPDAVKGGARTAHKSPAPR